MTGDLETVPAEPETVEADASVDLEALADEQNEGSEEPVAEAEPEDDSEEFDWNGQKIRGPKGLKDGVLMHADYTRKTQEVAATRKELEEREQRIKQQAEATEEYLDIRAKRLNVAKELERFKDFDWETYQRAAQEDPVGANEAWNYAAHLRTQHQELTDKLQQHETQRSSETQQEYAKRLNETQQFAREKIPGWTPETDKQVVEFALSKGISQEQLAGAMNPVVYEMLHLARIGAQTLSKPVATAKPVAPPPAPLQVVGAKSNAPARKTFVDMDVDEYIAARKAGRGG